MGAFESSENYELSPPPPSRSTLFVVRNGRYEPQNLMPILPRSDMLDFDGFVVRRGAGQGCLNARPPEMRQASLLKNPVSVRRDSAKAIAPRGHRAPTPVQDDAHPSSIEEDAFPSFSFVFDAIKSGTLTLHLVVTEVEQPLETETKPPVAEEIDKKKKGKGPSTIKIVSREAAGEPDPKPEDDAFLLKDAPSVLPLALETRRVDKGLGQTYQSPLLDLNKFPSEQLCFDPSRPRNVPIAVRLEADVSPGEQTSVQYTYISLQYVAPSSSTTGDAKAPSPAARGQWSAHIYSQKLQYGLQCFVLHEVFGVSSKMALDTEVEGGNSDCVICLSEPRDTAVLPCRHMCFCSYCAGIVRLQCDRCPVCRQKVQSLLQFKRDLDVQISTDPLGGGKTMDMDLNPSMTAAAASASVQGASASASAGPTMPFSNSPAVPTAVGSMR